MNSVLRKLRAALKTTAVFALVSGIGGVTPASAQKWHFGIGTGLARLNVEGDQGLNVALGGVGPVQFEVDLSPDDFQDLMQSAIGGGGYATDGKWMIQFAFAQLKLGGDPSTTLPNGERLSSDLSFDITTGEVTVGYPLYRGPGGKVSISPFVGFRYIKHDIGISLTLTGATTNTATVGRDWNWTDVLVGGTVNVAMAPKVSWSGGVNAAFGGSNGTFDVQTAVTWRLWRGLSISPNGWFTKIDYENGNRGDADWYLYDVNEFGSGLTAMVNF